MNAIKRRYLGVIWLTILFASFSAYGQATAKADVKGFSEEKLKSVLMARDMPYRVILPSKYASDTSARFPVIYLLHGLTGHYSNWIDRTSLTKYSADHQSIIVTPEGDNGWYADSVSTPNDKYESYIMQELIPEIDKRFRTLSDREHRIIAGLSMGGFGAIKFGLKYPDKFSLVGSFSGALGAAGWTEKNAGAIAKSMDMAFGPDEASESRKANDIFRLLREVTPDQQKALPYVYVSCGTEDFLIANNRDFLKLLNDKKIPHEYREHPGGHDWTFWDEQVREFLMVAERRTKR